MEPASLTARNTAVAGSDRHVSAFARRSFQHAEHHLSCKYMQVKETGEKRRLSFSRLLPSHGLLNSFCFFYVPYALEQAGVYVRLRLRILLYIDPELVFCFLLSAVLMFVCHESFLLIINRCLLIFAENTAAIHVFRSHSFHKYAACLSKRRGSFWFSFFIQQKNPFTLNGFP